MYSSYTCFRFEDQHMSFVINLFEFLFLRFKILSSDFKKNKMNRNKKNINLIIFIQKSFLQK